MSGESESVNQLSSRKSETNVSQGAVLFLDHVVVNVSDRESDTVLQISDGLLH